MRSCEGYCGNKVYWKRKHHYSRYQINYSIRLDHGKRAKRLECYTPEEIGEHSYPVDPELKRSMNALIRYADLSPRMQPGCHLGTPPRTCAAEPKSIKRQPATGPSRSEMANTILTLRLALGKAMSLQTGDFNEK